MEGTESENQEGIGSVRAAISLYGERINGRKQEKLKAKAPLQENSPSKAGELHVAKIGIDRLNETRVSAEKEKACAEAELSAAKSMAKELARKIEEANSKARAKKSELNSVRKQERSAKRLGYEEVIRELEDVKKELSRLKLDSASALEAKAKAEEEIEASTSKAMAYSQSVEEIKEEIEEANEEHVLVEIARIEAERERREIEAKREAEADQFAKNLEAARKRIEDLKREINRAKELESKLAVTKSDVEVLRNEMELVRAMERKDKENCSQKDDLEGRSMLRSAQAELDAAKRELGAIKEEGFQFMASMDQIRKEMLRISEETERLKKLGKKADSHVQHLNSKLLKAKSKLESAAAAEERTKGIVSNLSSALQQLKNETEGVKKEKETIDNETQNIRSENEKADVEISSIEERLQAAVKELEAAKASELAALKKLRIATEKAMKARASSAMLKSSTLTISKGEYDYLSKRAAAAQLVADKKVAASRAWIEALKAGEKEMLMRAAHLEKQMREARAMEKEKLFEAERALSDKRKIEEQVHETNWTEENEEEGEGSTLPAGAAAALRKSLRNENGNRGGPRRSKMRRVSASSAVTRSARSPSFTIKKKRKVMPNLVKFLRDRRNEK